MEFFTTAVTGLKLVVTAIGAGVGVWGVINLLEGYGNDNPGAKSQGIKQLMSGGGIIVVAQTVIPQLSNLFSQYRVKAPAVTVTGRGDVGHAQARMTDFTPVVRLLAIRSEHDSYFLHIAELNGRSCGAKRPHSAISGR